MSLAAASDPRRSVRASGAVAIGHGRSEALAKRLGIGLFESRTARRMTQRDLSARTGISQTFISSLERGRGAQAPIDTWAVLAAATGQQLAAFFERAPGATGPLDREHLRRQQLVIEHARPGGWKAEVEAAVDDAWSRSRSIDVVLMRPSEREIIAVEIWDLLTDIGAGMRSLEGKVAALDRRQSHGRDMLAPAWTVRGLWVVRATNRNRALVREFAAVFAARFPGSSTAWVRA